MLGVAAGLAVAVAIIALHELIHGVCHAIFAKNGWKSVKFGIKLKYGVAYCITCTEPLKVRHFRVVEIMPAIILGFIPGILSLFIGYFPLLLLGVVVIAANADNFWRLLRLAKENKDDYTLDIPDEVNALLVYRKINDDDRLPAE